MGTLHFTPNGYAVQINKKYKTASILTDFNVGEELVWLQMPQYNLSLHKGLTTEHTPAFLMTIYCKRTGAIWVEQVQHANETEVGELLHTPKSIQYTMIAGLHSFLILQDGSNFVPHTPVHQYSLS